MLSSAERPTHRLTRFPRPGLAHLPTPIEAMKQLTVHLAKDGTWPRLWAKREDRVGVGLGGLISPIRAGRWTAARNIVFNHTGGAPALFAYRHLFD